MNQITPEILKQYKEMYDNIWSEVYTIFQITVLPEDRYSQFENFEISDDRKTVEIEYKDCDYDTYYFDFPIEWFSKSSDEILEEYKKMRDENLF